MKDTVCALLSWDKADLEHKKEYVPVMINGKEKGDLSKRH